MRCSVCNSEMVEVRWDDVPPRACYCSVCDRFGLAEGDEVIEVGCSYSPDVEIPTLEEGTRVFICNEKHPFFLSFGIVADRDHVHYRVKFGDKLVWVPEHWVRKIPKELIRGKAIN